MAKRKTPSKSEQEKALSRRNIIIASIVGVTVILTFLIELPQKISATINVFRATESFTPSNTPEPSAIPTNTDSPTTTIQPTASFTALPTSKAEILFSDTFDANRNSWVLGEIEGVYSKQNREISNGVFVFKTIFFTDGSFVWANSQNFRVKNFHMTIDVDIAQKSKNSDTAVVIGFRYGNLGKTTYAITFGSDSSFSFYAKNDENWTLIYKENSNAFQIKEGAKNTFGLTANEQRFTIYANGQELYTLEESNFNYDYEGEIGIGSKGNSGDSMLVKFDNLTITELP